MTRQRAVYQEWNRTEWADGGADALAPHPDEPIRWNKFQWVGDQGQGTSTRWRQPADMPEGEGGFSGFRHSPGGQHWAGSR
jgi:hypothetical protein